MDEQAIREIVEAAFKTEFKDVEILRINVRPGFDHDDDPIVDVNIIYDGKVEQLGGAGIVRVRSEIISKVRDRDDPARDPAFPLVHFIAKSDIGKRDPATV